MVKISRCAISWYLFAEVVEVATLQDPLCIIRGLNDSGEMSTDVFVQPIISFFYEMEALSVLDPDEFDLFVLHCIFLPRINQSLAFFAQACNLHPLRTKKKLDTSANYDQQYDKRI